MKKTINNKEKKPNIFKKIYGFFDKHLITPLSKLAYNISEKFTIKSGTFEKFLNKPNTLLYISLFLAFLTFIVIDKSIINLVETDSIVLEKRPVEAEYNDEAYVVEGLPKEADIVLRGRKGELYLAKQLGEHKVSIDLSNLGEGRHKVSLKYNNPVKKLDYKLDPSKVNIYIHPKVSEVRTLSVDVINTDKLSETLVVKEVKLDRDEVIIKSYEEKLSTVASVKALIDLKTLNIKEAGTYTMENVKLIAYDEKGTEVEDIEIVPGNVTATIKITSPSKKVPVKVVPVGQLAPGSAIASIEKSVSEITIYGDETILENINFLEVKIDVANLKEDKEYQKVLIKPNGTRSLSESSITIKVKMEKESTKEFKDITIAQVNLADNLKVSADSEEDTKVNVVVKGVKSLIDKLKPEDIKAYIDLKDMEAGRHQVPVYVTGNDLKLTYTSKKQKVYIEINEK